MDKSILYHSLHGVHPSMNLSGYTHGHAANGPQLNVEVSHLSRGWDA